MKSLIPIGFAASVALAMALAPKTASAGISQVYLDFESSNQGWFMTGGAGLDFNVGLAHKGVGNGWVRQTQGWNAINNWIHVRPNSPCTASAWLRVSDAVTDGYMSVRNDMSAVGNSNVINEIKLVGPGQPNPGDYNLYTFDFYSGDNSQVLFYVGLWGNGRDAWIQVDDVAITCQTPY